MARYEKLQETLRSLAGSRPLALAYSGGLDSRFAAHAARQAGVPILLLHAAGPHVPPAESAYARQWAAEHGFGYQEIMVDVLAVPAVAAGDRMRCYHCKRAVFSRLREHAPDATLCDGTHLSDMQGYRPGLAALRELGVASPLALAGFTKAGIRAVAESTGLDCPDQRARPCLLTRLDYGLAPAEGLLAALAEGEALVRKTLASLNCERDFRLRLVSPGAAELHIQREQQSPALSAPASYSANAAWADLAAFLHENGLHLARVLEMESLSGYFDRTGVSSPCIIP